MKIIRNMSIEELCCLTSGMEIEGRIQKCRSTIKTGICFFGIENEYQANTWHHDICVVFEADPSLLTEGFGVYPDWASSYDTLVLTEYSIKKYNINTFEPLYWYWKHEINVVYPVK